MALLLAGECAVAEASDGGITFNAAYTGDLARTASGGIKTGGTYLDNLDLQLAAEASAIRDEIRGIGPLRQAAALP